MTPMLAVTGRRHGSLNRVAIGLLGLTFKAGTDDLRDSPALEVARRLSAEGAELRGYDPAVTGNPRPTPNCPSGPTCPRPCAAR